MLLGAVAQPTWSRYGRLARGPAERIDSFRDKKAGAWNLLGTARAASWGRGDPHELQEMVFLSSDAEWPLPQAPGPS